MSALPRALAGAAFLFSAASAETFVRGGQLKLTWQDCGSQHGKPTSLSPDTLTLGTPTTVVGKGTVDEDVSAGSYELEVSAGIIKVLDHTGDICKGETIELPHGIGSIKWKGLACPEKKGEVEIDMDLTLSSAIPASLARTTIQMTAKASNGDNLLCLKINTAPAEEEEAAVAPAPLAGLIPAGLLDPKVQGGVLDIDWKDCGSVHGKAQSLEPSTMTLGNPTTIVGKGTLDESVSAGSYELKIAAGPITLLDHKGDLCKGETIQLPHGVGSMNWVGLKCTQAAGPLEVDMSMTLSASIPAAFARTTITLTALDQQSQNLLCLELHTKPASALTVEPTPTWSYEQYAVEVDWSGNNQTYKVETLSQSHIAGGSNISASLIGYPPFYLFFTGNANPYIQFPRFVYNSGFDWKDLSLCQRGEWQDQSVTYENGPSFLKKHPKENWTQCFIGADGGLGGGSRWYLYFANFQASKQQESLVVV